MPATVRTVADLGRESSPDRMVFDRRGRLFVGCDGDCSVVEILPAGRIGEKWMLGGGEHSLADLIAAPDGDIWAVTLEPSAAYRIRPSTGRLTCFPLPNAAGPVALVCTAAGVFIANEGTATVSRIERDGTVTASFARLREEAQPIGLVAGENGALFTANWGNGSISRIAPDGSVAHSVAQVPADLAPIGILSRRNGIHLVSCTGASVTWFDSKRNTVRTRRSLAAPGFIGFGMAGDSSSTYIAGTESTILKIADNRLETVEKIDFGGDVSMNSCAVDPTGRLHAVDLLSGRILALETGPARSADDSRPGLTA